MTRTFRKRTRDTSGRRNPPTRRARPGHKHKHNDKPYCQLCHNEMTDEMDVGRLLPVRVCDRDVCRDAARALKGENDGT